MEAAEARVEHDLVIVYRDPADLRDDPDNPMIHSDAQVEQIAASMDVFGWTNPVLVDETDGIIAGHGRKAAALLRGRSRVPTITLRGLTDAQKRALVVADNQLGRTSTWDIGLLSARLTDLRGGGFDVGLLGFSADDLASMLGGGNAGGEQQGGTKGGAGSLSAQFMIPPFSVLNAREGWWQERKRGWIALGIQSELGRGSNALDMSAQMAGLTDPAEIAAWNEARRSRGAVGAHQSTPPHGPTVTQGPDGKLVYGRPKGAEPGGSARPAADYSRRERGDGSGAPIAPNGRRADARAFGQDLMRGEHVVGQSPPPRMGNGKPAGAAFYPEGYTDDVSKKIMASGARPQSPQGLTFGQIDMDGPTASGTSIFDPVLTELAYRWFSPQGGVVLDPFAGGSVRGIVAQRLGRAYVGIDLRPEQIAANRAQAARICDGAAAAPVWHIGDSRDVLQRLQADAPRVDFLFSCPPYADLEVYSDDPADLSTMDYPQFLEAYREIIRKAAALLADDRFACFIVGDVRDRAGCYRNFVGDTVTAFLDAGMHLWNEAILVTSAGSLPIRAAKQFSTSRKLGKTHQNVLVFVKGDGRRATAACGAVVVDEALHAVIDAARDPDEEPPPEDDEGSNPDAAAAAPADDGADVAVRVSAKMARLEFAGCQPDYIRDVCHGRCCESSTAPSGTIISIHPTEVAALEARGARIVDGLLQTPTGRCQFKTPANLCGLHGQPDKPFGCIASPFTLNAQGTLIVRNRYRLLKCFKDGARLPAYRAFRASLDLIFGAAEAARICDALDAGGGDVDARMPRASWAMLRDNDAAKPHVSRPQAGTAPAA
jgi:hypothetical protein